LKAVAAIPARLQSTRFPRKVLADIHGKPMLWHVCQGVAQAKMIDEIWVLTDSKEVFDAAGSWGVKAVMTAEDCPSGTDRIASVVSVLDAEIIVNVQGDEPLIDPELIDELGRRATMSDADMVTPLVKITDPKILTSATTVKVVITEEGIALYFSRSPIPFVRDAAPEEWVEKSDFWLQVGTYAFRKNVLLEYRHWPESALEKLEKIEQLRFLEAGKTIQTFETHSHSMAVDTPEDLEKVRQIMAG